MVEINKFLQKFADDETTFEVIKSELLNAGNTKDIDITKTNEEVGAELRARIRAKELIEAEFRRIRSLRTNKQVEVIKNQAR